MSALQASRNGADSQHSETHKVGLRIAPWQAERQDDRQRKEGNDSTAICEQRPGRRDLQGQGEGQHKGSCKVTDRLTIGLASDEGFKVRVRVSNPNLAEQRDEAVADDDEVRRAGAQLVDHQHRRQHGAELAAQGSPHLQCASHSCRSSTL